MVGSGVGHALRDRNRCKLLTASVLGYGGFALFRLVARLYMLQPSGLNPCDEDLLRLLLIANYRNRPDTAEICGVTFIADALFGFSKLRSQPVSTAVAHVIFPPRKLIEFTHKLVCNTIELHLPDDFMGESICSCRCCRRRRPYTAAAATAAAAVTIFGFHALQILLRNGWRRLRTAVSCWRKTSSRFEVQASTSACIFLLSILFFLASSIASSWIVPLCALDPVPGMPRRNFGRAAVPSPLWSASGSGADLLFGETGRPMAIDLNQSARPHDVRRTLPERDECVSRVSRAASFML